LANREFDAADFNTERLWLHREGAERGNPSVELFSALSPRLSPTAAFFLNPPFRRGRGRMMMDWPYR
jgi:hypothetical protein